MPRPTGGTRSEIACHFDSSGLLAGRPHFWHTASAGTAINVFPQKLHLILTAEVRDAEREEDFDFLEGEEVELIGTAGKIIVGKQKTNFTQKGWHVLLRKGRIQGKACPGF